MENRVRYKNIFIVTYGRTGSTLLQGVLNSIEGVYVAGKNMGVCYGLYKAYTSLKNAKKMAGNLPSTPTHPFYGAESINLELFLQGIQSILRQQIVPSEMESPSCWGFKEIRYTTEFLGGGDRSRLADYLNFMGKLFPDA